MGCSFRRIKPGHPTQASPRSQSSGRTRIMRLIFIGPPGSGKGTQAELLATRLNLKHFSTGEILRESIIKDTPEGQQAKPYVQAGQLVPDILVNEIVNSRFRA